MRRKEWGSSRTTRARPVRSIDRTADIMAHVACLRLPFPGELTEAIEKGSLTTSHSVKKNPPPQQPAPISTTLPKSRNLRSRQDVLRCNPPQEFPGARPYVQCHPPPLVVFPGLTTCYSEADGAFLRCRYVRLLATRSCLFSTPGPSIIRLASSSVMVGGLWRRVWSEKTGRGAELTGSRSRHRLRHQLGTSGLNEEYAHFLNEDPTPVFLSLSESIYSHETASVITGDEFKNDPRNPYAKKAAH